MISGQRSLATGSPAVKGFVRARVSKVARLLSLAFATRFSWPPPSLAKRRHSSRTGGGSCGIIDTEKLWLGHADRLFTAESRPRRGGGADPEDLPARPLVVDHLMLGHVLETLVQERLGNSVA